MRFMGATWRRSGLSKAAMRAYYNDVHGPIVAQDPAEIYRYDQNVVEDSVFYCEDAHAPFTQPDGLTEFLTADQDSFERSFKAPHMAQVAWPDTLVYADLSIAISVAGEERTVLGSVAGEEGATKVLWFILVPPGTKRATTVLSDKLATILSDAGRNNPGIRLCRLVTEYEQPNAFISNTFARPSPRAVAGISMFLAQDCPWEMPDVAEALIKATDEVMGAEASAFSMLVTPTNVVNRPAPS